MSKEIGDDDVIDDIIKSKGRSKFWTSVTLLIFKLERRTNAQNVGNWTGLFGCYTDFKIFSIITFVVIMFRVIIILEILLSVKH